MGPIIQILELVIHDKTELPRPSAKNNGACLEYGAILPRAVES